jgi:hypothetical protein
MLSWFLILIVTFRLTNLDLFFPRQSACAAFQKYSGHSCSTLLHKQKPSHGVIIAANGCNLSRHKDRVIVKNQLVAFPHIRSMFF